MHDHAKFIDALGGVTEVARAMDIDNTSVVGNWRNRGVAWRYRLRMARLAGEKRVRLPQDFLAFLEESAA